MARPAVHGSGQESSRAAARGSELRADDGADDVAADGLPGRTVRAEDDPGATDPTVLEEAEPPREEVPEELPSASGAVALTDTFEGSPTGVPRWLLLLAGLAAATIAIAGLRAIAWLAGPILLALVVVVGLMPVSSWLRRHGAPRWVATVVLLVLVWSVLLGFVALLVVSVAQLAALLPDYAGRAEELIDGVVTDLNDAGLVSGQLSDLVAQIDYGSVVGLATGMLGRITAAASTLVLLLSALVFMAIESSGYGRRLALVAKERPHLPVAFNLFASGTRSYLLVSTVFGAIVAVGDAIALAILAVPAAPLWGLLAFITNYVPNIGFVLGVVPPALLGLLAGGWGELIAILVIYTLLNFVVQTLIQPRFVGDSVGLSMTVTFIALLFWGWVLGALGALLAIPLTLLVKALLVDVDPRGHWLDALLREEPRAPRTSRARRRMNARRSAMASVRRLHHPRRAPGEGAAEEETATPAG
ncbi:Predicted PurR-regulated permease PerM [Blastococcus aggregatus]|uniref:Predicted PurR-regulated permease PerM n=1 Tax=Blastococcus aggregatus TaxID=38502 RepID=A0A285V6Y6_9ACTN|nr:AI-2E family transporter [Blastococcus aggregatus]SOC49773.1 Predicted PurR-regulated permease PerM [Blastococcus aggregatus]